MRELLQEEIDSAPKWANSVFANGYGDLIWFNNVNGRFQSVVDNVCKGHDLGKSHYAFIQNKPIPRHAFKLSETLPIMEPTITQLSELVAIREAKGELSDPALIVASLIHLALIEEKDSEIHR